MGVCQTQMKSTKNKNDKPVTKGKKINSAFAATTDPLIKSKQPQRARMNIQDIINSPQSAGCILSQRQQTTSGMKKIVGQLCNSQRNLQSQAVEMSASKKYSLIKQRLANNDVKYWLSQDLSVMQNNKTGKLVIMETLQKTQKLNTKYAEWLQNAKLDHPNVNRMIELFQDQNQYQIIFEHFNGTPLSQLILEETKVKKPLMAQIIQQVMEAVHYLHQLNIVHGNLTLDSFHYQEKNDGIVVKLMNLKGIFVKDEENVEVMLLTPPSIVYNPNVYTIQRDIWSIGIMAMTLRSGKYPYDIGLNGGLDKIQQEIKQFESDFSEKKDPSYKSFLSQILQQPKRKIAEKQIKKLDFYLAHQFIKQYQEVKQKPQSQLLQNLLLSKPSCLLQQFILCYIVKELNWEEYLRIEKLFYEGDSNMDGYLCKGDVLRLFNLYFENLENIEERIDTLFQTLELGDDMLIDNTLFITLSTNKKELLTKSNIEICFGIFSNNKPEITLRSLRRHLNNDSEEFVTEFYNLTGDDKTINLTQFTKIMEMML